MSTNQNSKEEEVDLGSLFIIIGNGFRKVFNFFIKIFVGFFDFIILILLFIKKNILKLGIAAIVGGLYGGYLEFNEDIIYGSDLVVQPNFKSSRQLYNNIDYYNELVNQEEYKKLSETFGIDSLTASYLTGFEVTPLRTNNDILESYNELILSVDTTTVKSYSFLDFKKAFTDFDYKRHQVHVEAKDNKVFSKLGSTIISSIENNDYFRKVRELKQENLYRSDSIIRQNLNHIDSLRKVYNKVLLEEAKKQSSSTSIDLGSQNQNLIKELELFNTNRSMNYELKKVVEEISEKSEVINVISDFQPVGYVIKGITKNRIFIYGGLCFIIMTSFILLLRLNKYLDSYKKNK